MVMVTGIAGAAKGSLVNPRVQGRLSLPALPPWTVAISATREKHDV